MADWYIYVIAFSDEMHKIGISIDPQNRLRTLATEKPMGVDPRGLAYMRKVPKERARVIETRAHGFLSDRRYPSSEYFFCYSDAAIAAVDLALLMEKEVMPDKRLFDLDGPTRNPPRKRYDSPGRPPKHVWPEATDRFLLNLWKDRNVPRETFFAQAEKQLGYLPEVSVFKRRYGPRGAK